MSVAASCWSPWGEPKGNLQPRRDPARRTNHTCCRADNTWRHTNITRRTRTSPGATKPADFRRACPGRNHNWSATSRERHGFCSPPRLVRGEATTFWRTPRSSGTACAIQDLVVDGPGRPSSRVQNGAGLVQESCIRVHPGGGFCAFLGAVRGGICHRGWRDGVFRRLHTPYGTETASRAGIVSHRSVVASTRTSRVESGSRQTCDGSS